MSSLLSVTLNPTYKKLSQPACLHVTVEQYFMVFRTFLPFFVGLWAFLWCEHANLSCWIHIVLKVMLAIRMQAWLLHSRFVKWWWSCDEIELVMVPLGGPHVTSYQRCVTIILSDHLTRYSLVVVFQCEVHLRFPRSLLSCSHSWCIWEGHLLGSGQWCLVCWCTWFCGNLNSCNSSHVSILREILNWKADHEDGGKFIYEFLFCGVLSTRYMCLKLQTNFV